MEAVKDNVLESASAIDDRFTSSENSARLTGNTQSSNPEDRVKTDKPLTMLSNGFTTRRQSSINSIYEDDLSSKQKFVVNVESTMNALLEQEDVDRDCLITVDDNGPKLFIPESLTPKAGQELRVRGTYALGLLLQELSFAQNRGEKYVELTMDQLAEDPVQRLKRFIRDTFWNSLTRRMDAEGIEAAAPDPKAADGRPRIYIPAGAPEQYKYYTDLAAAKPEMCLDVQWLPTGDVDANFIKSINSKPGILALAMEEGSDARKLQGLPFIVPGGRFNELYNWDCAFCAGWGMLDTHPHLVRSTIKHFIFEIQHYGKILNANRSYYLGRAQPPFLTTLALTNYQSTEKTKESKELLKNAILAAIKEYHDYWMAPSRHDEESGLTRYRPFGLGFPPECESTQFDHILRPFAEKYQLSIAAVAEAYNNGQIHEPALDLFCLHDKAVRESGHDVSMRTEGVCADLGTIDLNCLLYKYETDIAYVIRSIFDNELLVPTAYRPAEKEGGRAESSADWDEAAKKRKEVIDRYLWNEEKGLYFDYNTRTKQQTTFESVTSFWALWCGVASPHQAALLVEKGLPKFEQVGGLTVGTEASRGPIDAAHPQKQWDFPYGWPPHQILAWDGLKRYGYDVEAERLVYRWLHMIIEVFVNYNGTVVEKYDVTQLERPHRVDAEYGNQGLNFKYAPREGFGWTNASVIHGLSLLSRHAKRALGVGAPYEVYVNKAKVSSSQ